MEANASRYRGKAPNELDWTDAQRQKRDVAEYLAGLEAEAQDQEDKDDRSGGSDGHRPQSSQEPKRISSGRLKSRVHSSRNPGSCAQPRAWRGFGASMESGTRPETFSRLSTAGSLRASARWT